MLLAYSARSKSGGMVERSQAGLYLMGGFLAGYVPPPATTLDAPLTVDAARWRLSLLIVIKVANFDGVHLGDQLTRQTAHNARLRYPCAHSTFGATIPDTEASSLP